MTNKYDKYAEEYLSQWKVLDADACDILTNPSGESLEKRAKKLDGVLWDYGINDNFEGKQTPREKRDFKPILEIVDAVSESDLKRDGAVKTVERVYQKFFECYGRRTLVATSKILWFKFQSPIVIRDSRAMKALGLKEKQCSYDIFYSEWHKKFKAEEAAISKACDELAKKHPEYKKIISERSFRERVFDICLWNEGK